MELIIGIGLILLLVLTRLSPSSGFYWQFLLLLRRSFSNLPYHEAESTWRMHRARCLRAIPPGLANALRKLAADTKTLRTANEATAHLYIINPLKAAGGTTQRFSTLFSTHPPINERIKRLDEMSLGEAF